MTNNQYDSIGNLNNDKYLVTTKTLEIAEIIRKSLIFDFNPPTKVFVLESINRKTGWDIFISTHLDSLPSKEHYRIALKLAKSIIKNKNIS